MFEGLFQPMHLLLIAVLGFLVVTPFWQIFKKAGFSPLLSLLMLFPPASLFTLYYVAFARWPRQSK
jgi:hypothetical protein